MPKIEGLLKGRPLETLPGTESVMGAARAMAEKKIGCILVTDAAGRPAGIFTERDLMTRVVVPGKDPHAVAIEDVMTRELFTTTKDERVADMRRELQQRHIRHLPVVEDGVAIEMLSLRDLLAADLAATKFEQRVLKEYIKGSVDQSPEQ